MIYKTTKNYTNLKDVTNLKYPQAKTIGLCYMFDAKSFFACYASSVNNLENMVKL